MKVSVAMLTYQHELYVSEALESVLSQRTNFDYEIVAGDDASSDDTQNILLNYAKHNNEIFRLLLHQSNIGISANLKKVLSSCSGEYVAFLEGDDYWKDPWKLHRQVELLDSDPSIVLCGHQTITVKEGREVEGSIWPQGERTVFGPEEALQDLLFRTCTVMCRRSAIEQLPDSLWSIFPPDRAFQILLAQKGQAALIPAVMAAYRVHPGGVWSGLEMLARRRVNLDFFRCLSPLIEPEYKPILRAQIYGRWRSMILGLARNGKQLEAFKEYFALLASPRIWGQNPRHILSLSFWSRFLGLNNQRDRSLPVC